MLANASKQRLSSSERRAAIIKAAVELFSSRGFRGATTREIAAAVGVTEPVLYQHFETKQELYTAIVDDMLSQMEARGNARIAKCGEINDDRVFFQILGETVLEWFTDQTAGCRLLILSELEGHELAEIWNERATKKIRDFIEGYLARRAAEGVLNVPEPEMAARAFLGMVAHYGLCTTILRSWTPRKPSREAVADFVEIFLNGIKK